MDTHTSTSGMRLIGKMCEDKSTYKNRKEAEEMCNELYDSHSIRRKIYKCPICFKFHLATVR
jgi:hypothetical protein